MIHILSWRWTYVIYGGIVLLIGMFGVIVFKPVAQAKPCHHEYLHNPYKEKTDAGYNTFGNHTTHMHDLENKDHDSCSRTTIFIVGGLWLLASLFKGLAHTTPHFIMVTEF